MTLMMSRPWKHPKTGIYWLRKRVPDDLRPVLGRLEEKKSLKTRDPAEAKRLLAQALIELDRQWANLRSGPKSMTEREAHEIAIEYHDRWLRHYGDNPSEQTFWRADLYPMLWQPPEHMPIDYAFNWDFDRDKLKRREMQQWCEDGAKTVLTGRGLIVDEASQLRVAKALAAATQRASITLSRMAAGHYPAPNAVVPTIQSEDIGRPSLLPPLRFDEIVDGWAAERKPVAKTLYEWRRVLKQLATFLGHDDARRVTPDNLIAWKTSMLQAGRRSKTVRDAQIAPVRAVFRWAVDNRRMDQNPAERIVIDVKIVPGERRRSYTDDEAKIVIRAALKAQDPLRRWVPLLCAYSGARVSEVCQLRREDIVSIGGIWCIKFDPTAGTLKTDTSERTVPIHPELLRLGFIAFAETVRSGPLFVNLKPDKFEKRGGNATKTVGRWIRSLGLTDKRIAPNHSWRHRMKTLGRRHGLAPDISDAITGHGRRSVADNYGEFEVAAMFRELSKIPAIDVGAGS